MGCNEDRSARRQPELLPVTPSYRGTGSSGPAPQGCGDRHRAKSAPRERVQHRLIPQDQRDASGPPKPIVYGSSARACQAFLRDDDKCQRRVRRAAAPLRPSCKASDPPEPFVHIPRLWRTFILRNPAHPSSHSFHGTWPNRPTNLLLSYDRASPANPFVHIAVASTTQGPRCLDTFAVASAVRHPRNATDSPHPGPANNRARCLIGDPARTASIPHRLTGRGRLESNRLEWSLRHGAIRHRFVPADRGWTHPWLPTGTRSLSAS